jgi:hypothetical protein
MRIIYKVVFVIFIFSQGTIAQNQFGTPGSYWRYNFEHHSGDGSGWTQIGIEKDTLIENINYKKYRWKYFHQSFMGEITELTDTGLLHINNDSVFVNGNLILDFNMTPSDMMEIYAGDDGPYLQLSVDSIKTIEIAGESYRTWHGQKICIDGHEEGPYDEFIILESIGQIENGYLFWNLDGCMLGGGRNNFDCYKNGEFTYPEGVSCEERFLTDTKDGPEDLKVEIFPNPTYERLTVKMEKMRSFSLYTISGAEILSGSMVQNYFHLDLSHLDT